MSTPLPQVAISLLAPFTSSPPLELTAEQLHCHGTFPATSHTTAGTYEHPPHTPPDRGRAR
jgi:hypothetical protein